MHFLSEIIEKKFIEAGIVPIKFFHDSNYHNNGGQLIKYSLKRNHRSVDNLFLLLYVDDGAGIFSSRSDAITGSNIIFKEMARLGLNMHIGRNKKPSKTEAVFFSSKKNYLDLVKRQRK